MEDIDNRYGGAGSFHLSHWKLTLDLHSMTVCVGGALKADGHFLKNIHALRPT